MKTQNLSLLFIAAGLCIAVYSFFNSGSRVINVGETYIVTEPQIFTLILIGYYSLIALVYFIIHKYDNYSIGIINLVLTSIPLIYYIASSSIESRSTVTTSEILSDSYQWQNVYIPQMMIVAFLIGNILLVLNTIIATTNYFKMNR